METNDEFDNGTTITMSANGPADRLDNQPAILRDPAFGGMLLTQFLGAFNDNLFKQLILLICVDFVGATGRDYQPMAMAVFAIPFILFSGFAGFLSDRTGKRKVVVLCKVAEIVVMLLGMAAFLTGIRDQNLLLNCLFVVLFLMGCQSAFFGPSKYGILPELFRESDLPTANGLIQMTTFLAIIFGMALAGYAKDWFGEHQLWMVSGICMAIATLGTGTSLLIRKTSTAQPDLKFEPRNMAIGRSTVRMLLADHPLLGVLLCSSLFWFTGGVVQQAVNAFGKRQLGYSDSRTSLMAACMGVGISLGCVMAGRLSHHRVNFHLVTLGSWGLVLTLLGVAIVGQLTEPLSSPANGEIKVVESLQSLLIPDRTSEWTIRLLLTGLGFFAGLFIVPLQVFMQARPPEEQKGRMIGAMNLTNWIAILISAGFFGLCNLLFGEKGLTAWPICWTFGCLAVILLPIATLYHPSVDGETGQ